MNLVLTICIIITVATMAGITGVGGVLLIPVLVVVMGMDTHVATGTVLASMILPAGYAGLLYARKGAFDKNLVVPLAIGGALFGYLGGVIKPYVSAGSITILLAAIVVVAGVSALRTPKPGTLQIGQAPLKTQRIFLVILGSFVGLLSGIAGCGGGVLTIPIMVVCGFPVLATVCAGMLFTLPAGISSSIPNIMHGYVDWITLTWALAAQIVGTFFGVNIATRISGTLLRKLVAVVCVFTGIFLVVRVFWQG